MSDGRPEVTLVVDGVEVRAPEGMMLVDAAKHGGDIEIPVFCYESKLGAPVGACRMCLVEIEGIPKLQTACSTPVRDGMVVYTQTGRVTEAQNAVVEFLLVNHPLDCPVCDRGGECPLQDIAMGWGPGRSRFTDPKRHFEKPVPLSPLVRIDRERCILCYRCVRFSQEVAEDEQLQLLERGSATYVGTFDDRPYIAPFHGNVIELCPVGALTSEAYRFRARPWDIEDAGTVCTLCPSQCNVKLTVRDEAVQRVLARDNAAVDDGWLCDKGRFGFQMIASEERITEPLVRDGGELRPAGWDEALERAAAGLRGAGERSAAIAGGGTSNEEGFLLGRVLREGLASPHLASRDGDALPRALLADLARPELAAAMPDIDAATSVLVVGLDPMHAMPILDLRIRKALRRFGTGLALASERPTTLDGGASAVARYIPGEAASFLSELVRALGSGGPVSDPEVQAVADTLDPGGTVIVYGEGLADDPAGVEALSRLSELARALRLEEAGAGLIGVPVAANGRGLREVGVEPGLGPGLSDAPAGLGARGMREALAAGELGAVVLANVDPVREMSGGPAWAEALRGAGFVLAVAAFENGATAAADVVFPAETHAEKEGTVTHPDGRIQRLRPGVPHPGSVAMGWRVLAELADRLGLETGYGSAPGVLDSLAAAVPFYAGITHEEIGGPGIRWQEREAARAFPSKAGAGAPPSVTSDAGAGRDRPPSEPPSWGAPTPASAAGDAGASGHGLRLGTYRDLWADWVPEHNPALRFLAPEQAVELSPGDAERLGLADGEAVEVSENGTPVGARVAIRERVRPGSVFMIAGTARDNANALRPGAEVEVARVPGDRTEGTGS